MGEEADVARNDWEMEQASIGAAKDHASRIRTRKVLLRRSAHLNGSATSAELFVRALEDFLEYHR